jgi:hypothetical protein
VQRKEPFGLLRRRGAVLLQRDTLETKAQEPHFYSRILKRPIWLAGVAL